MSRFNTQTYIPDALDRLCEAVFLQAVQETRRGDGPSRQWLLESGDEWLNALDTSLPVNDFHEWVKKGCAT